MFSDFNNLHGYNLRTSYILKDVGSNMTSGDKYIRHHLPVVINNLKSDILNKVDTHSLDGFVFYIKRIWLNEYKTECVEPNCYVCNRRS